MTTDDAMGKGPDRDFFFGAYDEGGAAPWRTGRPQPALQRAADAGLVRGRVLDVGCGSGENALLFAERGHVVWGVDMVPGAIEAAQATAADRGLEARFRVADALALEELGRRFDTVIDSGLFHVFSDEERPRFRAGLERVLEPGGRYLLLCFSDAEPAGAGPRRVSEAEIRGTFAAPWTVVSLERTRFESLIHPGGAHGWIGILEAPAGS